jgi:hypothetical protein
MAGKSASNSSAVLATIFAGSSGLTNIFTDVPLLPR